VAHCQVFRAWMQSQNLCSTYVLVLGRQETYCLHMEVDAMHAMYSLTTTTLHQVDHINTTSLLEHAKSQTWE
jgi:hypothetical protein